MPFSSSREEKQLLHTLVHVKLLPVDWKKHRCPEGIVKGAFLNEMHFVIKVTQFLLKIWKNNSSGFLFSAIPLAIYGCTRGEGTIMCTGLEKKLESNFPLSAKKIAEKIYAWIWILWPTFFFSWKLALPTFVYDVCRFTISAKRNSFSMHLFFLSSFFFFCRNKNKRLYFSSAIDIWKDWIDVVGHRWLLFLDSKQMHRYPRKTWMLPSICWQDFTASCCYVWRLFLNKRKRKKD